MHLGFSVSHDLYLCCHLLQSLWAMELVCGASLNFLCCACTLGLGAAGEVLPKMVRAHRRQQLKDNGAEKPCAVDRIEGKQPHLVCVYFAGCLLL